MWPEHSSHTLVDVEATDHDGGELSVICTACGACSCHKRDTLRLPCSPTA